MDVECPAYLRSMICTIMESRVFRRVEVIREAGVKLWNNG